MTEEHVHEFERYLQIEWTYGGVVETTQVFTSAKDWPGFTGYVGYECRCGEQGYAVPA